MLMLEAGLLFGAVNLFNRTGNMDRFLRVNRGQSSIGGNSLGGGDIKPTIIVQPFPVPPTVAPEFIQNTTLEARVACDPSGQPAFEGTVRGRAVLKSEYGDGTNGYTKIEAPSSNSSLTAGPGGLIANTPGIGVGSVMTCMDTNGLAYWQPPTQLLSAVDPATCFIRLGAYNIQLETNFDQPAGKLRLRIQTSILPGQVLTSTGSDGECQWVDLPAFPEAAPIPSIFASNADLLVNTTPTVLYPGRLPTSTAEYWSVTIDTTFVTSITTNLTWALVDTSGIQYGTSTTATATGGALVNIRHTYLLQNISPTEIRFTATAVQVINNATAVTVPARRVPLNPINGMPFPRISKSVAGSVVTCVSRAAYYTVLNWIPPVTAAPFSVAPDPFDGIVDIPDFDLPPPVAAMEAPAEELFVAEESVMLAAELVPALESAPPPKRQRRSGI